MNPGLGPLNKSSKGKREISDIPAESLFTKDKGLKSPMKPFCFCFFLFGHGALGATRKRGFLARKNLHIKQTSQSDKVVSFDPLYSGCR